MARLLLARHSEVPGGSPIFSTQSTASELICAEVDGSAALRAEAVHNGRFHVLSLPNWHFKPHTSPFKSVQQDFLARRISRLARSSRFYPTHNSWQIICLRKHGYSSLSTSLPVLEKANAPPN